ncbi:MAG TPA: hypothetical protein VGF86_06360 [Candidatus Tumulicola sp.]
MTFADERIAGRHFYAPCIQHPSCLGEPRSRVREVAALPLHGSLEAQRPDSRQSRGRVRCDVVADLFRAGKLSKPGASLRELEPHGRKVREIVNQARRALRHNARYAKAQLLFCPVILLNRKAERVRGDWIRAVPRANLFEETTVALRTAVQSGVPVLALALLGGLPDGATYRYHGIDVGAPLEIVRDNRITAQLGRLIEVAKQMPGGYLDRLRRIRARHDASSFSDIR